MRIEQCGSGLLQDLAVNELRSRRQLLDALSLSSEALQQELEQWQQLGIELGNDMDGYHLPHPVELLRAEKIVAQLLANGVEAENFQLFTVIDSTNRYLLRQAEVMGEGLKIALAEIQSAGRGRLGRQWQAPLGSGVTLSLLQSLRLPANQLAGFSLAMGICVAEALESLGVEDLALKWPNDLQVDGRKLAGLLIEVVRLPEAIGVVTGLGLNYALRVEQGCAIDQPWIDLQQVLSDRLPSRQQVVTTLICALAKGYRRYVAEGFAPFYARWPRWDRLQGRDVNLLFPNRVVQGVADGIERDGSLRVMVDGELKRYHSGEVSVRGLS